MAAARCGWLSGVDAVVVAHSVTTTVPPADQWVVLTTGAVGLLITGLGLPADTGWWGKAMACLHMLSTIVHEVGHVTVSLIAGGKGHKIVIDSPFSGVTYSPKAPWLATIARIAAGYAAPPLAGLGIAALLDRGHAHTVLILTAALMVLVFPVSFGVLSKASVGAVGFATFAAMYWGSAGVQQWVAYTEAWLLLLCETVGLWALIVIRRNGSHGRLVDDAAALARKTLIPAPVWILAWYALHGWAIWTAAPLLWP
jgi:Peptidase M50B-like